MFKTAAFRRPSTIALALTLSLGLAACGGTSTPTPTVTSVSVTSSDADNTLTVGQTATVAATVTGENSPSTGVTFSSDNEAVARVDGNGMVTAVSPGTATITATSTADTSKSGSVTFTVVAAPVTLTPAVSINFQPAAAATPAGYVPNTGAAYNAATGIGWVTETSAGTAAPAPLDMTANTRDRSGRTDTVAGRPQEEYTQLNMQCGTATPPCLTGTGTSGAFEYRVVNGQYNVTVSVGETVRGDLAGSTMNLNVEGTAFTTGFTPTEAAPSSVITKTVTVADGSLTVDAKGGKNTKIQYLKIAPAAAQ